MAGRANRLVALTVACLCAPITAALAWSGTGSSGLGGSHGGGHAFHGRTIPGVVVRHPFAGRRFSRMNGPFQQGVAGVVWPYWPFPGPYASQFTEAPVVEPETIVIARTLPYNPPPATQQPLPDLTYVAGCHAIPNGYHCDTSQ